jgi:hypothetical protein
MNIGITILDIYYARQVLGTVEWSGVGWGGTVLYVDVFYKT